MSNKNTNSILAVNGGMDCVREITYSSRNDNRINGYLLNAPVYDINKYVEEMRKYTKKPIIYDDRYGNIPTKKLDSLVEFGIKKVIVREDSGIEYTEFNEIEPIVDVSNKNRKSIRIARFRPHIREFATDELYGNFNIYFNKCAFYIGENDFSRVSEDDLNRAEFEINVISDFKNYLRQDKEVKLAA